VPIIDDTSIPPIKCSKVVRGVYKLECAML
jgi:hypothetical protein